MLAWQAHNQTDARVLILTFNRALAADLRRLWTLQGYPDEGMTGLRVRTTMSYSYGVLRALEVLSADADDFTVRYKEYKRYALELFAGGALCPDDIGRLGAEDPAAFLCDYVFIDESQDWPEDEGDPPAGFFPRPPIRPRRRPGATRETRSPVRLGGEGATKMGYASSQGIAVCG